MSDDAELFSENPFQISNMKTLSLLIVLIFLASASACDVQSGITKKSVEKYEPTPTPERIVVAEEPPIDPADIITAEAATPGPQIFISKADQKTANCDKYNRISVNGSGRIVTVKGVCSQLMINGVGNYGNWRGVRGNCCQRPPKQSSIFKIRERKSAENNRQWRRKCHRQNRLSG